MTIRVVLAEDHLMFREALRTILEKARDMEVVGEAGDGRTAMQLVREFSPDVIVLDIAMPEMNGIDAAASLHARHPRTRILALSAYSGKRYVEEMLKAGAAGYVTKGSAGTELLRAIRSLAQGKSYLCPEAASAVIGNIGDRAEDPGVRAALGQREREVLQLIAEGHRSQQIADRLCISVATVEVHRRNIMRKLGLHSVAELTKYAIREGLTPG